MFGHLGPVFLLSNYSLPVLPFFMDGQLAVHVFFVLSGFVLSVEYLQTGKPQVLKALLIRRYPRLAIPVIVSCFLAAVLVLAKFTHNYEAGRLAQSPWLSSLYAFDVSMLGALEFGLFHVFVDPARPSYNDVLWTMLYELWGSVILLVFFLTIKKRALVLSGYAILGLTAAYFRNPLLAFLLGMVLADFYTQYKNRIDENGSTVKIISVLTLAVALLFAMFRIHFEHSNFLLSCSAMLIVGAICFNKRGQSFLQHPISQFLGRISFPLYLTHILILCTWSSWLYLAMRSLALPFFFIAISVVISSVAIALVAAVLFSPIEKFAIHFSRALSRKFLST